MGKTQKMACNTAGNEFILEFNQTCNVWMEK